MPRQNRYDLATLILRIALGSMFVAHGWLKIAVFTPAGTAQFFSSLGLPGWLAYPVIAAEVIGGLMIVAGLAGRWASLALLPVLFGAAWVHGGNGWLFSNEQGGWEYPLFLIAAAAVHILLGDGRLTVANLGGARLRSVPASA